MTIRLELGSGPNPHEGYMHLDIDPNAKDVDIVADMREGIPLDDNSCIEILAVNCIEHIRWQDVGKIIAEMYRVLKPGGVASVHLPDIEYVNCVLHSDKWKKDCGLQPLNAAEDAWQYLNHFVMSIGTDESDASRWNDHKSVYNYPLTERLFLNAGFTSCRYVPLRHCFFIHATK
jgi:predicted SAM-dependent methyltransferase